MAAVPHRLTLESIRLQRRRPGEVAYECGCERRGARRWHLCSYHEGFDDGVDAADISVGNA